MKSLNQNQFETVKGELLAVLPRLYRYARNLSGNAADAEDLLQATSERVLSRWQQFRPGSDFDRWAFTIMHSIQNNTFRSESVRQWHGHEDADAAETLIAPESQSPERNIIQQQVFESLEGLPAAQRQTMILVYVEGFNYAAAAEILEIPIGTVMSRIGRARVKLARDLSVNDEKILSPERGSNVSAAKVTGERARTRQSRSDQSRSSGQQVGDLLQTVFKR